MALQGEVCAERASAVVSAVGAAGVALAGAVAVGAPPLSLSAQLAASLHYLRGASIGYLPSEQIHQDFIGKVTDGAGVTPADSPYQKLDYDGGFWR